MALTGPKREQQGQVQVSGRRLSEIGLVLSRPDLVRARSSADTPALFARVGVQVVGIEDCANVAQAVPSDGRDLCFRTRCSCEPCYRSSSQVVERHAHDAGCDASFAPGAPLKTALDAAAKTKKGPLILVNSGGKLWTAAAISRRLSPQESTRASTTQA